MKFPPPTFRHWYAVDRPREIARNYSAYAKALAEFFAFLFLIKTLFRPWKSITDSYPTRGLDIKRMFEAFTLNIITRAIGACIRLGAIVAGLLVEILLFVGFIIYVTMWLLSPLLLLIGLPLLIVISFT